MVKELIVSLQRCCRFSDAFLCEGRHEVFVLLFGGFICESAKINGNLTEETVYAATVSQLYCFILLKKKCPSLCCSTFN